MEQTNHGHFRTGIIKELPNSILTYGQTWTTHHAWTIESTDQAFCGLAMKMVTLILSFTKGKYAFHLR